MPTEFQPADPDFAQRVRASFGRQAAMDTLGASIVRVEPGEVEVRMVAAPHLTQQHGFIHGGVVGAVLDSACGYAASTLMPADAGVLTIEYKINFVAPARGRHLRMVGTVVKPGRTITLVDGRAFGIDAEGQEKLVATMTATMMTVAGRDGVKH